MIENENTVDQRVKDDVWFEILELEELGLVDEIPSKESLASKQEQWEKDLVSFREKQEKSFADEEMRLNDDKLTEKNKLENEITTYQQSLEQFEKDLLSFGFFAFSKKKKCKENIEETTMLLQNSKNDLSNLENKYKKKKASLEKKFQNQRDTLLPTLFESKQISPSPYQKLAVQNYLHQNWPKVLEKRKVGCTRYELSEMANLELKCYILICLTEMGGVTNYRKIAEVLSYAINKLSYFEPLIELYIKDSMLPNSILSYEEKLKDFLYPMGNHLGRLRREGLVDLYKGASWLK